MKKENRDYLEMTFRSVRCFADDGVFSEQDFNEIVAVALRDGAIDDNEKRVLVKIIATLGPAELSPAVRQQIAQLNSQYQLGAVVSG